ncbi:hypothetical protein QMM92_19145, partial [Leptospira santarosai]|nr:hypothetical protein [Leptospira santarosai]
MTSKEKDYWNILDAIEKNDLDRMVSHIRKSNFDINRESTYYMPFSLLVINIELYCLRSLK